MKSITALFIWFVAVNYSFSQQIVKEKAIQDFVFLNEAITNGHPINYDPSTPKVTINEVVERVKNIEKDSLTNREFRFLLHEAIYKIGCIHTRIAKTEEKAIKKDLFFPTLLFIKDGNLIDTLDTKINSINGISTSTLVKDIEFLYASDGQTNALSIDFFNKNSVAILLKYFNFPAEYIITSEIQNYLLKAIDTIPAYKAKSNIERRNVIVEKGTTVFYTMNSTPVLKLVSFNKKDRKLIKKSFFYLEKNDKQNLVLDLRGNLGGNRKATVLLTSYLVQKPFSYSILQPNLTTKKYLNSKGKFYLFLFKLKYNVGNVFKGKKTELGREFAFTFKPKKDNKNNFKGSIFVLIDGYTASASTMLTSWLKQYTTVTFIGKQSGGGYNGNNGGSFPLITLPNTKYQITFPAYRLILDKNSTQKEGIIPDVITEPILKGNTILEQTIQLIYETN